MCPRLTQKRELQARMAPLFVRMAVSGYGRARSDPRRSNFALGKPTRLKNQRRYVSYEGTRAGRTTHYAPLPREQRGANRKRDDRTRSSSTSDNHADAGISQEILEGSVRAEWVFS